jgi:carboxymethylenebutenolidase
VFELKVGVETFPAYLKEPLGKPVGAIIVVHEVWGLSDHIKSVADRFAVEGYVALAPDLLSDTDISGQATPDLQEGLFDPQRSGEVQPRLRELMAPMRSPEFAEVTLKKLQACFDFLESRADLRGRVFIIGFCFGGTYSFSLAVNEPGLRAAVPFYGHADFAVEELTGIRCPIRAFYGKNDQNLIVGLEDLKLKMRAAGVDFKATVYENCGHAFFNDTNRFTYNAKAAQSAWPATLTFLRSELEKI